MDTRLIASHPLKLNVLIVDDNEDQARTLQAVMATEGHEVHYCTSAVLALELITRWTPNVVFLDIGMPRMDGYEAALRFRKELPHARIYAVTGYARPEDKARAAAAGFDGHFTKPADVHDLLRVLR